MLGYPHASMIKRAPTTPRVTMGFELREHTADIGVAATADTLGEVFAAIADGLAAAHCDTIPASGEEFTVEERAENLDALLFEVLDRLIYERDVRSVLPVDHSVVVDRDNTHWTAVVTARGVPVADIEAREIKAVTYSEMTLEETDTGWHAYVVFDV